MNASFIRAANAAIERDCPICHCEMILPTIVPACRHKFCFLCLKGVNMSNLGGCPICRGPIDENIFKKPQQDLDLKMAVPGSPAPSTSAPLRVVKDEPVEEEDVKPDVNALNASMAAASSGASSSTPTAPAAARNMYWVYHGRQQGWWRFDPRIEKDIEEAFVNQMPMTEVTICGQPYVIDFCQMAQFPKNHRTSSREVKRVNDEEFDQMNVKGMAGVFVRH